MEEILNKISENCLRLVQISEEDEIHQINIPFLEVKHLDDACCYEGDTYVVFYRNRPFIGKSNKNWSATLLCDNTIDVYGPAIIADSKSPFLEMKVDEVQRLLLQKELEETEEYYYSSQEISDSDFSDCSCQSDCECEL